MEKMEFGFVGGRPIRGEALSVEQSVEDFTRELGNQKDLPELAVFLDQYAAAGDATKYIPGMGPIVQKFMDMHQTMQKEPWKSTELAEDFSDAVMAMTHDPNVAPLVAPILRRVRIIVADKSDYELDQAA